ncbi:MAG TPA: hypothetical protein VGD89_11600 [Flavipsychrobacter sp.]
MKKILFLSTIALASFVSARAQSIALSFNPDPIVATATGAFNVTLYAYDLSTCALVGTSNTFNVTNTTNNAVYDMNDPNNWVGSTIPSGTWVWGEALIENPCASIGATTTTLRCPVYAAKDGLFPAGFSTCPATSRQPDGCIIIDNACSGSTLAVGEKFYVMFGGSGSQNGTVNIEGPY